MAAFGMEHCWIPHTCTAPEAYSCISDTPWIEAMAPSLAKVSENGTLSSGANRDPNIETIAAFSPSSSQPSPTTRQRSTILVHKKSPLLVATPPPITRALAFSHPFILALNKTAGLLSWTSGDPWESFLVVAGFWALVLYGDSMIQWAGPVMVVIGFILGMYARRFSPLSSTGWTGEKQKGHNKALSEGSMRHQKSLDEIVETLTVFTTRCNVLLEPFLHMTDFLSTQRTATSASTRPALTILFIRILFITPIWILMTLTPIGIITARRVVLAVGTLMLTWHSRPSRVCRAVLWRSKTIRHIVSMMTGLSFNKEVAGVPPLPRRPGEPPPLPPRNNNQHAAATSLFQKGPEPAGVRFTFVVYENQRRWLGLGWTYSLMFNERAPWTDEHLNPSGSKDDFQLPEVDHGNAEWRWVEGSEWKVEGAGKSKVDANEDGWIYYDNKVTSESHVGLVLTDSNIVERWSPWKRWLGPLYPPPEMVQRR